MPKISRALLHVFILACATAAPAHAEMSLSLPGISEDGFAPDQVLSGFGCEGANLSPELVWSDAPPETKSFIVSIHDPDAPTGSGFWHWSSFNIPATVTRLAEGAGSASGGMPAGAVMARNDFSHNQYDGACPPEGSTHKYLVTVFVMPTDSIPLDETASAAIVGFFAKTASIARASVVVTHGR